MAGIRADVEASPGTVFKDVINAPVLSVKDMSVSIKTDNGIVRAVRGVSFSLSQGKTLAIVGESGSGKTMTCKGIIGLLPPGGVIDNGTVTLCGLDVTRAHEKTMRQVRGFNVSMIFQDPLTSLNPTTPIGRQIEEMMVLHRPDMNESARKARVFEMLDLVGISNPAERIRQYPHQFSGGMRQRVMIAIALTLSPKLLIADEPTTALDVTIQAQILELMNDIQRKTNTAIVIITHNLGVVASVADHVAVMYGGRIIEEGGVENIFYSRKHPYTQGLLDSVPKINRAKERLFSIPGSPPDLVNPPEGCPFAARCGSRMRVCGSYVPPIMEFGGGHSAACWLYDKRATAPPSAVSATPMLS
ncbi:MAG: ABC transporter ATP-binding protein [Oscillospiraceae bacterium]|jgi:oligopeptide/dipeptide ABC transporter ATP-binding protein|nr:ABC transporter ATP-binding protein [Oscillospiraceae bacterium]